MALYDDLVKIQLADKVIALAEAYESEDEYLSSAESFGMDVQELLVEHGTKWNEVQP
jgi:hypothetical protein